MCDSTCSPGLDRRGLLLTGAGLAAGAAVLRVDPAVAEVGRRTKRYVFTGEFTNPATPDWHYLPFRVPKGVNRIHVAYTHEPDDSGLGVSYNVVDIGIFDPSGKGLGNAEGFRGWSGGARDHFFLTRGKATPGYLAGPLTPGRWHVLLGPYQIVGDGTPYRVVVTLSFGPKGPRFVPSPAPEAIAGTGPGWYRGDLHTHTVHSDGRHTQTSLATLAQDADLDLIGSSEHNNCSATLTWGRHAPADLLVLNGEEVTTRSGHWLAMGLPPGSWIDWRYRAADDELSRFTEQVRALGGVAIAAHPFHVVPSIKWEHGYDYAGMDAVEVWNGAWGQLGVNNRQALTHWHSLLVADTFVPAVGNSDTHNEGQTVGRAQTVYRLETLSRDAVLDAIRGGHCWITQSSAVGLTFNATFGGQTAECGDRLAASDTDTVAVRLEVTGAPGCFAVLHGASGPVGFAVADGEGNVLLETDVPASARFVRAEIGRPQVPTETPDQNTTIGDMVALTNPIFLQPPTTGTG